MTVALSKKITIAGPGGSSPSPQSYDLLVDQYGRLQWSEKSDPEDPVRPGTPVRKKMDFFGGGLGETVDMGRGGYYFHKNFNVENPFALRPRQGVTVVTLTDNANPVERMFEAEDDDSPANKYLYGLAATKSFKIQLSDQTLKEIKTFGAAPTVFAHGTYTGNGTSQSITGAGFEPCAVIVSGHSNDDSVLATADMDVGDSKPFFTGVIITTGITSLDADGFSVGASHTVNESGVKYCWEAWKAEAGLVATGTYAGDGTDDRNITGLGFRPGFLHIAGDTNQEIHTRLSTFADDGSAAFAGYLGIVADCIQSFLGDGFQIGTLDEVNSNGVNYYYLAVRESVYTFTSGTFTGNGEDGRAITGLGLTPVYVVLHVETHNGVHRSASNSGDETQRFLLGFSTNLIESLDADGFTVGSSDYANGVDLTVHYVAFCAGGGSPQVGKPASWLSLWRVPLGQEVPAQTLTTVHDEGGAGDDTWIQHYGLAAQHFETLENKIARARQDRKVSLCSADDITNPGNWAADYPVGPPGTVITDLVIWGGELAVLAEDGMYMFDGVATTKQQLPLFAGIKDSENGKNSVNWMSQIIVGAADALLRWVYGAAKGIGPDEIPGYVEAEGVSNEPIHLQHFGSAFLGKYIYNACYDGTNYHIIYGRPSGTGFRWDFLLTTTNVIKCLKVDSDRRLWFGWGNDAGFVQLERGGAPTGGNYGEASLTGSFYFPEMILADDAEVSLRMLKLVTRNNQTTLTWKMYAYRDGAAAEQVGAAGGFKTNGEEKLYWTAASDLKARRLRLRLDFACSSFSPETTPPECFDVVFYGTALGEDGDVITATVSLEAEGRTVETVLGEIDSHLNAGIRQVRDPVRGNLINVTIFHREEVNVRQKGHEEPTAAVMIFMRRGDVA